MSKYKVLWSDGEAAASRGGSPDHHIITYITAENEGEMYKIAYILRLLQIIKSASMKNMNPESLENEDQTGFFDEEEAAEWLERTDFTESDLNEINLDGIDGGEPWIISISLNDKEVYNCGYEGDEPYEDTDEDW